MAGAHQKDTGSAVMADFDKGKIREKRSLRNRDRALQAREHGLDGTLSKTELYQYHVANRLADKRSCLLCISSRRGAS